MQNTCNDQSSVDHIASSKLDGVVQISELKKHKLPTTREVIGRVYDVVDRDKLTFMQAVSQVANELSKHWTERNVYPVSLNTIIKRITHCMDGTSNEPGYRKVKSIKENKRHTPSYVNHCIRLNAKLDTLFDIFCENEEQRKKIETINTKMRDDDWEFLKLMRAPGRIGHCKEDRKFSMADAKRRQDQACRDRERVKRQNASFTDDGCCLIENASDDENEDDR